MYEVEVKVRADHDPVRGRLDALAAEPLGAVVQEDTYYDAPDRSFAETDEALRIRRERPATAGGADHWPEVRLTYKGPRIEDDSKTRVEHELSIGEPATMDAVLAALGFRPAAAVRKERDRFAVGEFTVTLDQVDDLGAYVEVETAARAEDVDARRASADDLLERLGLDPAASIRASYLELLQAG